MNNKIQSTIIDQIIKNTISFQELIKKNWKKVSNKILKEATREYLTFIMCCAVSVMQDNEASKEELDNFHREFYKKIIEADILKNDELLDYEKLSRERYMDFYRILSEGTEKDQLEGKRLNALIAKEVLYIQKLLLGCGEEKENALGELYTELFSGYNTLILQIQLMFSYL